MRLLTQDRNSFFPNFREIIPFKIFLSILLTVVFIKVCVFYFALLQVDVLAYPHGKWWLILNRWDAIHYQKIAEVGYAEFQNERQWKFNSYFPPLFPLLMFLLSKLTAVNFVTASLIVANLFSFLATYLLFYIVRVQFGSLKLAFRSSMLLNIFPSAYFLMAPYSESLFLFLIMLSFYGLHFQRNINLCCFALGLAVLTRSIGVVFFPLIFLEFISKQKLELKHLPAFLFLLISFFIPLWINLKYYGDLFFSYKHRPPGVIEFGFIPFRELLHTVVQVMYLPKYLLNWHFMFTQGFSSIFLFLATLITLSSIKKVPAIYSRFSLCNIFFLSLFTWATPMPRYVLCIFPLFISLSLMKNRALFYFYCLCSLGLLIYFAGEFARGRGAY